MSSVSRLLKYTYTFTIKQSTSDGDIHDIRGGRESSNWSRKEGCCLNAQMLQLFSWFFQYSTALSLRLFKCVLRGFLMFFFHILFVINTIILWLFLLVIMHLGLKTKVVSSPSKFYPMGVVFHSTLNPW